MHSIKITLSRLCVYDVSAELGLRVESGLFGRMLVKEKECYKLIYFHIFCFHKLPRWGKLPKTERWKVDKIYGFLISEVVHHNVFGTWFSKVLGINTPSQNNRCCVRAVPLSVCERMSTAADDGGLQLSVLSVPYWFL